MPFFYPGKNHGTLNGLEFTPESVDFRCMVSPAYQCLRHAKQGLPLLPGTRCVCDSGAFGKSDMLRRLTAWQAICRQLRFRDRLRREGMGPAWEFEAVMTYDLLLGVDEALVNGERIKRRGDAESASVAVRETLESAVAYHACRDLFGSSAIAYVAQGASIEQYVRCVRWLLKLVRPGHDWLALGGFCIIGMQRSLIPQFVETCRTIAPMCKAAGVHRVHVLGVTVVDALQAASSIFAERDIEFSTDSVSMETNAIKGCEFREENMLRPRRGGKYPAPSPFVQKWGKSSKLVDYYPATLAVDNIRRFTTWFARQGCGQERVHRPVATYQPQLFG